MQISVYTRHSAECPKRDDTHWRRCRCPKWMYCCDWKPTVQRSAKTRSWDEAEKKARLLEKGDVAHVDGVRVADATKAYLGDMKDRALSSNYQSKMKRELDALVEWCRVKPVRSLRELTLASLGEHRGEWPGGPMTRYKRQERLRSFFLYCKRHRWIAESPAEGLSRIKLQPNQKVPLTKEQYQSCLAHCQTERTRTMLMLLRNTGLRISDAARLERARVANGKLFLYTQKTGTPVNILLPDDLLTALAKLENDNPKYFFWSGTSDLKTPGVRWWENLKKVFKAAGVPWARCHTLRHTFAVELLLSGAPMDQVSTMLGHANMKTTLAHYNAWTKARQEQLEESIKRSWTIPN